MPNWCAGELKIRGKQDNVLRFLENELIQIESTFHHPSNTTREPVRWKITEANLLEMVDESEYSCAWFKGSHRMFVEGVCGESDAPEGERLIIMPDVKGAWTIDTAWLTEKSRRYKIDFKIYSFESGGEFNHDFEVHSGKVVIDKKIEFSDYAWECVCPTIGG